MGSNKNETLAKLFSVRLSGHVDLNEHTAFRLVHPMDSQILTLLNSSVVDWMEIETSVKNRVSDITMGQTIAS